MMTNYRAELYKAPPRLSDLRGDDFRRAIGERDRRNRAQWRESRQFGGLQRAIERLFGGRI